MNYQALGEKERSDVSSEYDFDVNGAHDYHQFGSNSRHQETPGQIAKYRN
jgi:hypothetical protein